MMRHVRISIVCCLLCAASVFADVKVVHTTDGRTLRGEVTETTTGYEVVTDMGSIPLTRSQVKSIEDAVEPADEFADRLEALEDDDLTGHLDLGRWAFDNDLLDEAETVFTKAIELDPKNREASLLLKQVQNLKARQEEDAKPDEGDDPEPTNGDDRDPVVPDTPAEWLLSIEDVYALRLAEVREGEGLRVKIVDDELIDEFSASMEGEELESGVEFDPDRFDKMSDEAKFEIMLRELGGDDTQFMPAFEIREDPEAFETFRKEVWPIVNRSCGRSECHGGATAPGGLRLLPTGADRNTDLSNRTFYSNFLILDRTRRGGARIIDRSTPEDSLLLQYLLPSEQAKLKHPLVAGREITVQFGSKRSKNYEMVLDWITYGLEGPVPPHYNVSFTLPASRTETSEPEVEEPVEEPTEDDDADDVSEEGDGSVDPETDDTDD